MDKSYFNNIDAFSKLAIESSTELGAINSRVMEKLTRHNLDLVNATVEISNQWISLLSETKNYPSLASQQMKLAGNYNDTVVEKLREATEALVNSRADYHQWMEKTGKTVEKTFTTPGSKKAA